MQICVQPLRTARSMDMTARAAVNTFIQLNCDGPGCDSLHEAELQEGDQIIDAWPRGWIVVNTQGIGLPNSEEQLLCPKCRLPILQALGYASYKEYADVVQATEEAVRPTADETIESIVEGMDVPLMLYSSDPSDLN